MKFSMVTFMASCPERTPQQFYDSFLPNKIENPKTGILCKEKRAHTRGFKHLVCINAGVPLGKTIGTATMKGTICGLEATATFFKTGKIRINTCLVKGCDLNEYSTEAVKEYMDGMCNCLGLALDTEVCFSNIINMTGIHRMEWGFVNSEFLRLMDRTKCSYVASPEPELFNYTWGVRLREHERVFFRVDGNSGVVQALGSKDFDELQGAWGQLEKILSSLNTKTALVPKKNNRTK